MFNNVESKKTALVLAGSLLGVWIAHGLTKGKSETILVLIGGSLGAIAGHEIYKKPKKVKS